MCVSWDFTLQDWTTEGCTTIIGEDRVVTCNCSHLTNFAVIVVMLLPYSVIIIIDSIIIGYLPTARKL